MFTIENLLRFHEYFDNKMISMKNFPLDFEKVRSTHISCGFFARMWKNLEEKRSCKSPPSGILSRGQRVSSSFQVSSFKKRYRLCTNGLCLIVHCTSKTAEENEEQIIKLNVSPNRQNINSLHQIL